MRSLPLVQSFKRCELQVVDGTVDEIIRIFALGWNYFGPGGVLIHYPDWEQ
jgi:hypothetical protein